MLRYTYFTLKEILQCNMLSSLAKYPIKFKALNLASSPSPRDQLTSSSPVSMVASADTSRSPPRTGQTFGVEVCVVCGDRASGKPFVLKYFLHCPFIVVYGIICYKNFQAKYSFKFSNVIANFVHGLNI